MPAEKQSKTSKKTPGKSAAKASAPKASKPSKTAAKPPRTATKSPKPSPRTADGPKTPKSAPKSAPTPQNDIWRLKVLCVAGPYWDSADTCIRTIDVPANTSLYDLHAAILESVRFEEHDDSVFTFFTAANYRGRRTYLADGQPLTPQTDIEAFESIPLADSLPDGPGRFLYYVFDALDPWVFLVGREPGARPRSPHEFYPCVRDELNVGADPVQHGDGLDDFADAEEGEEFHDLRERFRARRRAREESGMDDILDPMEDDGDEDEGGDDIRAFGGDDYDDYPDEEDGDDGDGW